MSEVHVCPICNGTGRVRSSFYSKDPGWGGEETRSEPYALCKACGGTGVIITKGTK